MYNILYVSDGNHMNQLLTEQDQARPKNVLHSTSYNAYNYDLKVTFTSKPTQTRKPTDRLL